MNATTSAIVTWTPEERGRAIGSRAVGFLVGGSIAAVVAAAAGVGFDAWFLALGVPAAALAGVVVAPSVRTHGGIVEATMLMAVTTTVIAEFLVFLPGLQLLATDPVGFLESLPAAVLIAFIGLIIVGMPMAVLTGPCAFVWAVVVRRLSPTWTASATASRWVNG